MIDHLTPTAKPGTLCGIIVVGFCFPLGKFFDSVGDIEVYLFDGDDLILVIIRFDMVDAFEQGSYANKEERNADILQALDDGYGQAVGT